MSAKSPRCEEVIVQFVVRTYDDVGRPVDEQVSKAMKVFRNAETRDFWGAVVDTTVAIMLKQPPPPAAPANGPVAVPARKARARS